MEYTHLQRWTHPEYYLGETWEEYFVAYGQHRDSDLLDQSNFACILDALGGESDTVVVARAKHFLVGWCETLLVHESDAARLEEAERLLAKLDDYPVLDEEDWSRREHEAACECWTSFDLRDRIHYCREYGVSIFAARRDELPSDDSGELLQALVA